MILTFFISPLVKNGFFLSEAFLMILFSKKMFDSTL
jgi:hypothetical protein